MFRVYACIVHQHDLRLVVVAGVICLLASLIAFSSFEQARRDHSRRLVWTGLAAVVAGLGIWATHFLAMLAYQPGIPVGYDLSTTLVSVAAAVLVTGIGWLVALSARPAMAVLGGAIVGAGVATMHYIGMSAVEVTGVMVWDSRLVTASVVIGVVLGAAAVWASRVKSRKIPGLAPVLLTVAICGLHFTAMAAVVVYPSNSVSISSGTVDSGVLAVEVTAAILLILLSGFGVLWFEHKLAQVQLAQAEQRAALADQVLQGAAERDALTAQLEREAAISSAALENMAQGLAVYDEHERLVVFNRKYAELYDIPARLLLVGTPFAEIRAYLVANHTLPAEADSLAQAAREAGGQGGRFEVHLLDGRIFEVLTRRMPSGGRISTHEDVTEARKSADDVAWLARHDALTGLPNRITFADRLADALAARQDNELALLMLDLDRFKEVNDTLGHPFGDQILKDVAVRLRALVEDKDTLTRLGGDEFAVIQTNTSGEEPAILAGRIIDALEQPFEFDGNTVVIGASVGISVAPRDSSDSDDLIKMCDLALYRAKEESRGTFRYFEPGMDARLRERRALEAGLRVAIREGQFEVYYQPLLDLGSGTIACFEALVRWHHPTRGIIQPTDFIPIAEETSLIIPIGEWVLRQACRDAATWPDDIKVAVNLSPAQFKRGDLITVTVNALAVAGLAAERLELEVTECVLLHDEAWVCELLDQLTALGVRIALDDFGTGYSSLSYLRSFPFTKIKIDRSFVADLAGTSDALAIIQATIQLSQKLGMEITAEGVETAEQLDVLTAEGCTHVQGFHVSRPVPAAQVQDLLIEYGAEGAVQARVAS